MRGVIPLSMKSDGFTTRSSRSVCRLPRKQLQGAALYTLQRKPLRARTRASPKHSRVVALVNVDLSPALLLGVGMMGSGLALYTIRSERPELSRDSDVFFSSIAILVGGILIFQGWRLDPLLLFGQLLTSGTALAFAIEVLNLRQAKASEKVLPESRDSQQFVDYEQEYEPRQVDRLPQPDDRRSYPQRNADDTSYKRSDQDDAQQWEPPPWESNQAYARQQQQYEDEDRQYSSPSYSSSRNDAYSDRDTAPNDRDQQQQDRRASDRNSNGRSSRDNRYSRQTWGGIDDVEDW